MYDAFQFYSLGLGEVYSISAANGGGTGDLLDAIVKELPAEDIKELIPIFIEYSKLLYTCANGVTKVDNTVAVGELSAERNCISSCFPKKFSAHIKRY